MIRQLRIKFILITMSFVCIVLIALFVGINLYHANSLEQQSYMTLQLALDRPQGEVPPNIRIGDDVPDGYMRDPVFVVAVGENGEPDLISADRVDVEEDQLARISAEVEKLGVQRGELPDYQLRYQVRPDTNGVRIAFVELTYEKGLIRNMVLISILAGIGALAAFFVASLWLSNWALKPVKGAWQRQRQFVADASHELKTPLTVILANAGILKSHPEDTVESQMNWVENTEQEANRMRGLVDNLLFLAKSDSPKAEEMFAPLQISDLVATTTLSFEPIAFEEHRTLEVCTEPNLAVQGNSDHLKQLVCILLDNALKYALPGSTVTLVLKGGQGQALLSVHNMGNPIGAEEKKHLFERFYRADTSRSEAGYGLGLSIAKAIVDNHKGKISVESDPVQGTTFSVLLPLITV